MPATPYSKLLVSVNSAAPTSGGLTVANGDTIDLSGESTVGWVQQRFEIYEYPVGFTAPAGWSTDAAGVYFYATDPYPPQITLPALGTWGKFLLRLTVNNGLDGAGSESLALVDESTALKILSPNNLSGMAHLEEGQFSTLKKWVADLQADLVLIDTLLGALGVPITRTLTAGAGLTGGGTLAADRTFDIVAADASITVNANSIQLLPAFNTLLTSATASVIASALAQRDGSGNCSFATVTLSAALFPATATPSITQADSASGAGALLTIRAQNALIGANVDGGSLLLKTGAAGDTTTNAAGSITLDTGNLPVSNIGAPVIFFSGVDGEYLRITNDVAGLGPSITGTSVRIGTAGPSLIIDGSTLLLSGGATLLDGPLTFSRGGTATITEADPVTGDPPGDLLIKAPGAFAGDTEDGGSITLQVGAAGDGASQAGTLTLDSGNLDGGGTSSPVIFKAGVDGEHLRIFSDNGAGSLSGATGLAFLSSPCALYVAPSGVSWTGQLSTSTYTITYAASIALNGNNGNKQKTTLTGNVTFAAPTNLQDGARYVLRVIQSSGGHTATWDAAFKFPNATAAADKTLSGGAGAIDVFEFECDGTSLFCVASPKNLT